MRSILAVICPPLAVLASGTRSQAAANTGLTLLFYVPGLVHALGIVDKYNVERRYESVFRVLAARAA
ncbi:MAG: YqaE/Pmp3 family rane protein [Gemmataceae bacterium]|nr:YqaE/Pmp3 family rane protein [Gemmataceae bacterium]